MAVADSLSPLWLSLEIAGLASLGTSVLGILAARSLLRRRLRLLLEPLILCPLVLPPTVIGYGLILVLGRNGPFGSLVEGGLLFTRSAAVIAAMTVSFPLMYISARAAFRQIDANLLDAAQTFGASRFQMLLGIQIPLALPGLTAGFLLAFARSLGEFGATLMVAGNIPSLTQTLPIALYFDVEAGDYQRAGLWCALAILLSALVMGLVNLVNSKRGR